MEEIKIDSTMAKHFTSDSAAPAAGGDLGRFAEMFGTTDPTQEKETDARPDGKAPGGSRTDVPRAR